MLARHIFLWTPQTKTSLELKYKFKNKDFPNNFCPYSSTRWIPGSLNFKHSHIRFSQYYLCNINVKHGILCFKKALQLTREPRRMSTGILRSHLPLHDWMQAIRRNASLDMSHSLFVEMQLSQLPTSTFKPWQNYWFSLSCKIICHGILMQVMLKL